MTGQDANDDDIEDKAVAPDNDVYGAIDPKPALHWVYLYRILNDQDVLAYQFKRTRAVRYQEMPSKIDEFLAEIAKGKLPDGHNLGQLEWRHRSFFVVVYEDPSGQLIKDNAATFDWTGGGGNHTFRNGMDIKIDGKYRRFLCVNYMLKKGGGDVGNPGEQFDVTVNHTHPRPRAHTDTGTNTGPPAP